MQRLPHVAWVATFSLGLGGLLVACGGIAVVEKDDGSGGSSSSSSATTGSSTSTGSGMTFEQSCAAYCENLEATQCTTQKCFDICVDAFSATNCTPQWKATIGCFGGFAGSTDLCNVVPPSCQDEVDALTTCGVILCMPNECGQTGPDQCTCTTHCGATTYESQCNGTLCDCFTNGVFVGSCPGGATCPGSVYGTCCGNVF